MSDVNKCGICFERFQLEDADADATLVQDMSQGLYLACGHGYCNECLQGFLRVVLHHNTRTFPPSCPETGCLYFAERERVNHVLSDADIAAWHRRIYEESIVNKVYCPKKDCSALHDGNLLAVDRHGTSVCQKCALRFCKQCLCPFHEGLTCAQYKLLPDDERDVDDRKTLKLAQDRNWRRCPTCRMLVEKINGCNHMSCRCGEHL